MLNVESFKLSEALPIQAGIKMNQPSLNGVSFKAAVIKALEGESLAAVPGETLIGDIFSMVAQADIAPLEIESAVIAPLPIDFSGWQETPGKSPPTDAKLVSGAALQEDVKAAAQQIAHTVETSQGQKTASHNVNPAMSEPALQDKPAQQEKPGQAQAQQQTASGESTKSGHAAKHAEGEKSAVKSGEQTNRNAEAKQEAPKELKQEQAGPARQALTADPDKVYVKVSEGNTLDRNKFTSDVSEKILTKLSEGVKQFEIQLEPKDLGKILIKLVMMQGRTEIIIQCMNPKTMQMVMTNAETIRSIVEERTGTHTTVSVKENEEARGDLEREGQQEQQNEQEQQQGKKLSKEETEIFLQQLRLGLSEELKT